MVIKILLGTIILYMLFVIIEMAQNKEINKKQTSLISDILTTEKEITSLISLLNKKICAIEDKMIDYNALYEKILDDKKLLSLKQYSNLADKISEIDKTMKKIESLKNLNALNVPEIKPLDDFDFTEYYR